MTLRMYLIFFRENNLSRFFFADLGNEKGLTFENIKLFQLILKRQCQLKYLTINSYYLKAPNNQQYYETTQ
jgi:hypothetical protein